jgi:hypothetical protein
MAVNGAMTEISGCSTREGRCSTPLFGAKGVKILRRSVIVSGALDSQAELSPRQKCGAREAFDSGWVQSYIAEAITGRFCQVCLAPALGHFTKTSR